MTLAQRISAWVRNVRQDQHQVNVWRRKLRIDKANAEKTSYTNDRRKRIVTDRRQLALQAKRLREAEAALTKLKRQQESGGSARMRAVHFALQYVGRHETPGRNNRAPWLDAWARRVGDWMVGQSWCGLYVWTCALLAGKKLDKRTVSTVAIREMAIAGIGGYRRWKPISQVQPGDFIIYGFPPSAGPMHVGMYVGNGRVVEGNTSDPNGSQNDGGGVYIKTVAERRPYIIGVAEPAY